MAYPKPELPFVVSFLYGVPVGESVLITKNDAGEFEIELWDDSLGPVITEAQANDAANDLTIINGQTFSQWRDEHNGDPAKTLRRLAKEALAATEQPHAALVRAVVIELVEFAAAQNAKHNDLLTWLSTQTTLTNRGALSAFAQQTPTPAQARTAILARLAAGEADN